MKEFYSKNDSKFSQLSPAEIILNLNQLLNNLENEVDLLNYLESAVKRDKKNFNQKEKQIILLKLTKFKIDSININKEIEEFSINYNNFNEYKKNDKNNCLEEDDIVKLTINDLNEKCKNILYIIKSFIIKYPKLFQLREKYLNSKISSMKHVNKKINKMPSITNIKNKNIKNESNFHKNNILSERNLKTNKNYLLDNIERRIKINILKDKIKNIQLNFDQAQINSNELTYNFITPSNKNIIGLKCNSFIKNESSNSNILTNMNNSISKEKLFCISKKKSFQKENDNKISNQNFHIHNSCNNSSINLNIINQNNDNKHNLNNISNMSKIIPNNYQNKTKRNSIDNNKNLNTNPNPQDLKIKGVKNTKNNYKAFNFPIKNILFSQRNQKNLQFKKLKPNIILKDKDKMNIINGNNTPKCQRPIETNNKVLYFKPSNRSKRSKSEYLFDSIKNEIFRTNNNSLNLNSNENYLRGFSFDNLSLNKFEIQKKHKNIIKKSKPNIRNRAINIFNDNLNEELERDNNKNFSFTFANKNVLNNNNILNNKVVIDYDFIMKTHDENTKLKNEINYLKKEIDNFKLIFQNLSSKVSQLEEQNDLLKKQNDEIIKLFMNKK